MRIKSTSGKRRVVPRRRTANAYIDCKMILPWFAIDILLFFVKGCSVMHSILHISLKLPVRICAGFIDVKLVDEEM